MWQIDKLAVILRQVAHVLGVSKGFVSRMWNRFQITKYVLHLHAGGQERSTTQAKD